MQSNSCYIWPTVIYKAIINKYNSFLPQYPGEIPQSTNLQKKLILIKNVSILQNYIFTCVKCLQRNVCKGTRVKNKQITDN